MFAKGFVVKNKREKNEEAQSTANVELFVKIKLVFLP